MKRLVSLLLVMFMVLSFAACSSKNKAANYVKNNGVEFGSEVCVAFQDYFLDNYNTYFIVYNSESDSFTFEYYSSDKYFETPPTSNSEVKNSTTIDLLTGKAKYYSEIRDGAYTGTATIDIETFSNSNKSLSDITINGKYEQVYNTVEQTFENTVYNTVAYMDILLKKNNANVTVKDFGFTAFGD